MAHRQGSIIKSVSDGGSINTASPHKHSHSTSYRVRFLDDASAAQAAGAARRGANMTGPSSKSASATAAATRTAHNRQLLAHIPPPARGSRRESRINVALTAPSSPRDLSASSSSLSTPRAWSLCDLSQLASELAKDSFPFALLTRPGLQSLPIDDYVKAVDILVDPAEYVSADVHSGSQAQVFRAYLHGTLVAVKVAADESVLQEYATICKLRHPNIVKPIAFSVFCDPDSRASSGSSSSGASVISNTSNIRDGNFVSMACYEFAANGDLASYIKRHPERRLDIAFLTNLFNDILCAIEYVGTFGYIHGDIKPENILIGKDGRARLADFGMCQPLGEKMQPQGTPSYMPPEVIRAWFSSNAPLAFTTAVDVFSFGVMMLRVLENRYPFQRLTKRLQDGDTLTEAELFDIYEMPKRLLRELEKKSPKFAVMVRLCLAASPDCRPSVLKLRSINSDLAIALSPRDLASLSHKQ